MKIRAQILLVALIVGLVPLSAGCSLTSSALPWSADSEIGGWLDWDGEGSWDNSSRVEALEEEAPAEPDAVAASPPPEGEVSERAGSNSQSDLRAGMVDDNAEWDDYLLYRLNYSGPPVHDRDISERYVVGVYDGQGRPVLGAEVAFYVDGEEVYSAYTYATGQTLFFPRALGIPEQVENITVMAEREGVSGEAELVRGETYELSIELEGERAQPQSLPVDVLFLLDATGSMQDEIDKLQSSIQMIANEIEGLPSRPDVRFALTAYRDRGDLFVSRTYDFTPDMAQFSEALSVVEADGGGDYPESLNEALHRAVHAPEWRPGHTARFIILIADAPPHLDYAQDHDYAVEMEEAARRGIKIFSIAASGLDDRGEYVYRQIAQFTQGRFIFLTYGAGGEPGDDTTHHVEDYTVDALDRVVVQLIEEELAYQE